jgi:hypothetical protein
MSNYASPPSKPPQPKAPKPPEALDPDKAARFKSRFKQVQALRALKAGNVSPIQSPKPSPLHLSSLPGMKPGK